MITCPTCRHEFPVPVFADVDPGGFTPDVKCPKCGYMFQSSSTGKKSSRPAQCNRFH